MGKQKPDTAKIETKTFNIDIKYLWSLLIFVFFLFCFSIFKNIQYPLFWADESMTVVGAQRVLEFGYPKVHDGKNVFYDLRHSNPTLGIDEKTDAYIGGTGWGHYYFGALALKIAVLTNDIYTKTGIIRSCFSTLGVVGLMIFVFLVTSVFKNKESKLLFAVGFFFLALFSVSLALLLREARYYSISIFLFSVIVGLYIKFRFGDGLNLWLLRFILIVALVAMFFTFAPAFFILMLVLGASELSFIISSFIKKQVLKNIIIENEPVVVCLLISLIFIYPFLDYFKVFEISEALAIYNNYSNKMHSDNISTIFKYFRTFELFWLYLLMKIVFLFNIKKLYVTNKKETLISLFCVFLFISYVYLIARIPNFIYTRYIILLTPILILSILFDFFSLITVHTSGKININFKLYGLTFLLFGFLIVSIFANSKNISGHITELSNPYKGPLDYTIPAIIEKYKKTDTLVIAANYEETSYMYYLGAKVIVGFIGNNLEEDSMKVPHVIAYRKPWGNFGDVFQDYFSKSQYTSQSFPIYDNPVNNIPELNFMPAFNHQFKTKLAQNQQESTELYFKK
ncbi:MAG: hypothetical protein EAZ27_09820 [Cytophagales bacterium]|nr:MAG: hypothetical protein EAZ27_09820 [Cytophagales bacterium]